jgi:hypothetical protein
LQEMEIAVTTELSSTTITNILEAVPGIKTVLRSPAADAMVNLTKAAVGISGFEIKDARELMRFAFRRGLINNEEHDRVIAEVEVAAQARQERIAARKAARDDKGRPHPKPKAVHAAKPKAAKKAPARKPAAKKTKPKPKAKAHKPAKPKAHKVTKPKPKAKVAKGKKRR